nr:MAG TPA: hypothetical protein [Caudoviricetes sp.]
MILAPFHKCGRLFFAKIPYIAFRRHFTDVSIFVSVEFCIGNF